MSFLSKLKFLHKQTTPFISGPVLLPFTSKISTQSSKKKKQLDLLTVKMIFFTQSLMMR